MSKENQLIADMRNSIKESYGADAANTFDLMIEEDRDSVLQQIIENGTQWMFSIFGYEDISDDSRESPYEFLYIEARSNAGLKANYLRIEEIKQKIVTECGKDHLYTFNLCLEYGSEEEMLNKINLSTNIDEYLTELLGAKNQQIEQPREVSSINDENMEPEIPLIKKETLTKEPSFIKISDSTDPYLLIEQGDALFKENIFYKAREYWNVALLIWTKPENEYKAI